jgi:hypothetical protein
MTDHIPNDLSHLSDAEFNSLCPQGEHAPGPEPLSPAAQAVLDAFENASDGEYVEGVWVVNERTMLAAALRAVVNQVTAVSTNLRQTKIRAEFLAIADELEGHA